MPRRSAGGLPASVEGEIAAISAQRFECFSRPLNLPEQTATSKAPTVLDREAAELLATPPPMLSGGLSERARQALARVVPALACGEESAIRVFCAEGDRLLQNPGAAEASARLMHQIAREEEVHDALLRHLQRGLPAPIDRDVLRSRAKSLFLHAAHRDPATHFVRVCELDAAVCQIMACLLNRGSPVAQHPLLHIVAARIRRDEARHVFAARRHVGHLGLPRIVRQAEAEKIRKRLIEVLQGIAVAFDDLGTDPDRLLRRIQMRSPP